MKKHDDPEGSKDLDAVIARSSGSSRLPEGPELPLEDGSDSVVHLLPEAHAVRSISLTVLAVLALCVALIAAKSLMAPVLLALLLSFVLAPVIRAFRRIGVAPPIAAFLVLGLCTAGVGFGLYKLSAPAFEWAEEIPELLRDAQQELGELRKPVEAVVRAADSVDELTVVAPAKQMVTTSSDDSARVASIGQVLGAGLVTLFLLFFLLASSDSFLRTIVRVLPKLRDKKIAVDVSREIESQIGRYLGTVFAINLGLGLAVTGWAAFMGLPSPYLWGTLAFVANFVPYAGAVAVAFILSIVAFVTFDDPSRVLLVPAGYLALSGLEGMLVTPSVLGKSLTLRPVVVFIWLVLWSWMWGIVGALLAVPLLVVFRILCDHVSSLTTLGQFLAREKGSIAWDEGAVPE